MIAALKETLASVPTKPGVYQFKNKDDEIIYIGKAKNLRSRVRSYFQKNKYQTPKNQSMIKRIENVEWIVVRSNVEALLTEANMIKEVQPKYNIDLKDDKSFPFIRISDEPYPQVLLTRKIEKDGSIDISIHLSIPEDEELLEIDEEKNTQIKIQFDKWREFNFTKHSKPFIAVLNRDTTKWSHEPLLSKKQREVKKLLDQGLSPQEIIKKTKISQATVYRIIKQLGQEIKEEKKDEKHHF